MSNSERKGFIYEVLVALAWDTAFDQSPILTPKLVGVTADQDLAWPNEKEPKCVASVTHWGSHEAAKMKFWRVHEDLFEVKAAFKNACFLSVVFDRNPKSDKNLCQLLNEITGGCGIADINCDAILTLQKYVKTARQQQAFGVGEDDMLHHARSIFKTDAQFRKAINNLGAKIKQCVESYDPDEFLSTIIDRATSKRNKSFRSPNSDPTFFKKSLVALIDIGDGLDEVFDAYETEKWDDLDNALHRKLRNNGCLAEADSLVLEYEPSAALLELLGEGRKWCATQLKRLKTIVENSDHPLYSYHDHLFDVTNTTKCSERLSALLEIKTVPELVSLLTKWGHGMNRCWPLDYAMAIQRANTKAKEFGFQKMSLACGIPYEGAPVSCPLPRYASGQKERLSKKQLKALAKEMLKLRKAWSKETVNAQTIQDDRRITLSKKFSSLDALLAIQLSERLPNCEFEANYRIKHPLSKAIKNSQAGSTYYNLTVTKGGKRAFIFVAAAYETTHKHKELSGRLRAAIGGGEIKKNDLRLLLVDGNLLSDNNRKPRIQMMKEAGWHGAFQFNEIDEITKTLKEHLKS